MDTQTFWIGLDLGETKTHMCVINDDGETVHELECETDVDKLSTAMALFPLERIATVAVEACGETHLVRKLRNAGFPITMFEARKAHNFLTVRCNKTDKGDARGLADLGRLGQKTVSKVHLKSPECEQLRSQLTIRKRVVMLRVATENVLRSRLASYGLRYRSTSAVGGVRKQVQTQLDRLLANDGIDLSDELSPLVNVCEDLQGYINKVERDLRKRAKANDVCRLLMEVPGVGPICALSFYSAVDDPTRFERASDVASYLGLGPKRYQSGEVSLTLGISKHGSKMTRAHLFIAAGVFGTTGPDCHLKQWYAALRERTGSKCARVALARKLSIVLLTMWKTGSHFEAHLGRSSSPS